MSNLSAYLHVPFCRKKCNYCDFFSAPPTDGAVSSYTDALCRQIRSSSEQGRGLDTVYIGGGTPSLLCEREISQIVTALRETFDLSLCREFTLECNPESVTPSLAETWRSLGIDRISMGVQSFCDPRLHALGRLHSADRAREAYGILRAVGFDNVSLDLMAALPDQTEDELRFDLESVLSLAPEHVSLYLLKVEPSSAFGRTGVAERDEEVQRTFYLLADSLLTAGGYEHYEISNFAKNGRRAVHNSVYWQGGEYLAFGPGASGYLRGIRYRIPDSTEAFCASNGSIPPIIEQTVDAQEALREQVLLGLRLSDGIPRSLIPPSAQAFVERLCGEGLAKLSSDRFSLTAEGFLVSNYVIGVLLDK